MSARIRRYQLEALGHGRSKYGAVKTKLDGFTFDSKREAAVYTQLKLLRDAGKISDLQIHPRIELSCHTPREGYKAVGYYEADFSFIENGVRKWIDVKGLDTALSKWKRRHVRTQYDIDVEIWR